jgi:hypothetical protein
LKSPRFNFLNKSLFTNLVLVFLVALGIFLRARQYLFNRSLWLDEATFSLNIIGRPLDRLLFEQLDGNQAAPLGLIFLTKYSTLFFGNSDLVLRLVPFVFGILGLFFAFGVARRAFSSDVARISFVALVAFAPILIYYSSEIKQYGIDATISLMLLWSLSFRAKREISDSAKEIPQSLRSFGMTIFHHALIGSFAIWFSHPSVFVLAAIGTTLVIQSLARREFQLALAYIAVILVWLVNFWMVYNVSLNAIAVNEYLVAYWQSGYAPLLFDNLGWYWESALGLVFIAFRQTDLTVVSAPPEWFDARNIFFLILTVAGLVSLFKFSRQLFSIVVLAIIVTVIVSSYQLYPFRNRMLLFLAPLVFLTASTCIDWLARFRLALAVSVSLIVLISMMVTSVPLAIHPHNAYDIKGVLAYIRAHREPLDAIALQFWSQPAYHFYAEQFSIAEMDVVATTTMDANPDDLLKSICANLPMRRTWVVFSHWYEQHTPIVERLRVVAPQLDEWQGDNAGAFLFDFSNEAICRSVKN